MSKFFAFFQNLFAGIGNILTGRISGRAPAAVVENIEPDTINVEGLPTVDQNLRVIDVRTDNPNFFF